VGSEVILQEAAQQLVQNRYLEALSEASVEPVAEPKINIVKLDVGEPFEFDIEVESKPELNLPAYHDLLREEPLEIPEPTEEQIDQELAAVAKEQAQMVPADDEPVSKGNRVVLNLEGYLETEDESEDSEAFVEDESYTLEIGSGTAVEGLEDQLIGLRVNEPQTIRLTYPENHPDVNLSGKPVRFEITVIENKRPDIPEINDELAKAVGLESLQELHEHVKENVKNRLETQAKNDRLARVMGKLKERVSVDVPESLVSDAIHSQLRELELSLAQIGANTQEFLDSRQMTPEALHEQLRPSAEEQVKEELLMEAIAKAEKLDVSEEEIAEIIASLADTYRQPVDDMLRYYKKTGEMELLRASALISKTRDYLASTVLDKEGESEE
jgi:trigger factor